MKTNDELREAKARALKHRNNDFDGLLDGIRNEMLNMRDCIRLYNRVYSNIELIETFERWSSDIKYAEQAIGEKIDGLEENSSEYWKDE